MNQDGTGPGFHDPKRSNSRGEIFIDLLADILPAVIGGDDFDDELRWKFQESRRDRVDLVFRYERHVRSADAVRMLWARALERLRPVIEAKL